MDIARTYVDMSARWMSSKQQRRRLTNRQKMFCVLGVTRLTGLGEIHISCEYRTTSATAPSYSDSDTYRRAQPGETLCPPGTAASEVLAAS